MIEIIDVQMDYSKFHRKPAEVRDRIRELKTIKLQTDLRTWRR